MSLRREILRMLPRAPVVPQAWYKRISGQIGNAIVQLFAVPGIWDTQCGFKAFSAGAAEQIFARATIDGWGFDIEVFGFGAGPALQDRHHPAHW